MNSWEILRYVHHIGSPITGTVTSRDTLKMHSGYPCGGLKLETESTYPALLPYGHLVDDYSSFSANVIPEVEAQINTVVFNFVDDTLYLSAKPNDLKESTVRKWQQYYDYIETLTIDSTITGVVESVKSFGLFVDIGGPFIGLVDIIHLPISSGIRLPNDHTIWPKVGDQIQCCVVYPRLHNQQIGLVWSPVQGAQSDGCN